MRPLELQVPSACAGLRLDQVLARLLPQHSRSRLARWIREERVTKQLTENQQMTLSLAAGASYVNDVSAFRFEPELAADVSADRFAREIAARSRGTPRIANRLLRRVRDYAEVKAEGRVTREVADAALRMLELSGTAISWISAVPTACSWRA